MRSKPIVCSISAFKATPAFFFANNVALALCIPIAVLTQWACFGQRPRWMMSVLGNLRWRWFGECVAWMLPFFLLGLGWSCTLVAGSTLLTAAVPADERPGAQGASDLLMGLMAAGGGALAGVIVHQVSFEALALGALGVAISIGLAAALSTARPQIQDTRT